MFSYASRSKKDYVHSWAEVSKGEQGLPAATIKALVMSNRVITISKRLHLRGQ